MAVLNVHVLKTANEGVLRNRCSRRALALENRGILEEIQKIAFLAECVNLNGNYIASSVKIRCSREN